MYDKKTKYKLVLLETKNADCTHGTEFGGYVRQWGGHVLPATKQNVYAGSC